MHAWVDRHPLPHPTYYTILLHSMATKTGNGVSIFVVALLLLSVSGGEMIAIAIAASESESGLTRSLLGENCFLLAFKKCMNPKEKVGHGRSAEFCLQVAQYYCDIGHMSP